MNSSSPDPFSASPASTGGGFFTTDKRTAFEAKSEAQRIAFAPMVFQACRVLVKSGLLEGVQKSGAPGVTIEELAAQAGLPRYGVKVLLEAGLGIGLVCCNAGRFSLTRLGFFLLRDPMTHINFEVVHEVCYRGLFDLETAVREGRPAGLASLGPWPTFYEGLSSLTEEARRSWLAFDHYYSDQAFPAALPLVFAASPCRLLDVGGNTGRWVAACAEHDPNVELAIADLPQQLELARSELRARHVAHRVQLLPMDLLNEETAIPPGFDAIWMSQFLDCFSESQIASILGRTARAMSPASRLYILELFWDRQPNETAAFCLQQTSLYFTCIANGNSQMYQSADLLRCLGPAGLELVEQRDRVGLYHTLLICRKSAST